MRNSLKYLVLFTIGVAFILSSCSKESDKKDSKEEFEFFKSATSTEANLTIKGDGKYEKIITNPLLKIDNCDYIVAGTIEYWLDGELIATIDYGDGACDDIATKIVGDQILEFSLKKEIGDDWFYKVITEPLVSLDDCDFIVAGVIEFYSKKDNSWLATIDFGDGECDEWATKVTEEGTYEFSMDKWEIKQ